MNIPSSGGGIKNSSFDFIKIINMIAIYQSVTRETKSIQSLFRSTDKI